MKTPVRRQEPSVRWFRSWSTLPAPAGQVDNVTDVDSGAGLGIAITAADTTNGTWFYSIDNGTTWNALGAVSDANARLLAADANTRLYFQANADYHGTLANAITFHAWDQTSGTNGGTADHVRYGIRDRTRQFQCSRPTATTTARESGPRTGLNQSESDRTELQR